MWKKAILFALAICCCMSVTIFASAIEPHPTPIDGSDYDKIAASKSARTGEIADNIGILEVTQEDMDAALMASETEEELSSPNDTALMAASWNYLHPFIYCSQETSSSCAIACVKMALRYITGKDYSESTIRTGCDAETGGAKIPNMISYINKEQSLTTYQGKYQATKTAMKDNIYTGIVRNNAPPIVGIKESTSDGWAFDLPAHSVIVYSILSDKTEVALCDPWGGYMNSQSPYRWVDKTTDDLYNGYIAINAGYMY